MTWRPSCSDGTFGAPVTFEVGEAEAKELRRMWRRVQENPRRDDLVAELRTLLDLYALCDARDVTPPAPARRRRRITDRIEQLPDFDGATFERERDKVRLAQQASRVWLILLDGEWHTLAELSERTGDPEASVSARIRDLRKEKFGGHEVEHENLGAGTWRYRLIRQNAPVEMTG
jgi:biotin operon repressor